jgi:hypothetical protein
MNRDDLRWFCIDLTGVVDFPDDLSLVDLTNILVQLLVSRDYVTSQRTYKAPCVIALLCSRYGFKHTNCVSMSPELSKMVHAIKILRSILPRLKNGSTVDSLSEGCCPHSRVPNYERLLQLDRSSLAAQVLCSDAPADHLRKHNCSITELRIALFRRSAGDCTASLQKVEFDNDLFYYAVFRTRLSKWIMFYFYHKNHLRADRSSVIQNGSQATVWTVGDIVSRRIFGAIGGLRHLGIVVGQLEDIVFIVDLDTNKRTCSYVAMKTMSEFASGFHVSIHRDVLRKGDPKRPRIPLDETLEFLYQSIGNNLKYSFFNSSDCDSFATFARYGVLLCNQVQIPPHKIHETISRISDPHTHPSLSSDRPNNR